MAFAYPERIALSQLPTPIEKLERLSKFLEGPRIYIKRDDLSGLALSGNKVRKLEFLLAEALAQGADYLITSGSCQSNHARTTAVAAARLGLRCHLVLRNNISAPYEGNLFIDKLVGAEIEYVTPEEYMRIDDCMFGVAEKLKSKGHTPYIIPEGGSNELGAFGYIKASEEIASQLRTLDEKIHHIVVPVGSGGTYAGLLLGKYLFDLSAEIHGINVCDTEAYFIKKINDIVRSVTKHYKLDINIPKNAINIVDGYVGKGYGLSSQPEIDMIKLVARHEGVILDPVYTAKAMCGVADRIRQGHFKPDENILFIHTGGIFGLFPKKALFF